MTLTFPQLSPIAFSVGPIVVRWYGIMYFLGYALGVYLARQRIKHGLVPMIAAQLDSLVGYLVFGMLVGARVVYALVYEPGHYLSDPLEFFRIWHGGLSFHGAVIGMTLACVLFARRNHVPTLAVTDTMSLAGTPGLAFGRLGNFINGELYGRVTNVPWAMVFPNDPLHLSRHPSQLYEALCEGVLLSLLLWSFDRRARASGWNKPGLVSAAFLVGYGALRFALEFTRQPDAQLGLVLGPLSAGQLLCVLMIVSGIAWLAIIYRSRAPGDAGVRPEAHGS
ncbi:MAG TPA: prolipoprotein diacylglyceryl transferase [Gemmatimonadaceae bacterium]|nr:prolipoprotein diacylglyceryl transferase [Gemmatimonadaceae bacterium]